ncbi:MAG TPA: sugar phosphate nucleotidyltransferase [Desulfatiglandales bacterium]|nr:sugar phosphate nucleotidyltransferase [Desulfatiglandales bacterium]
MIKREKHDHLYAVIMAGGKGTRFWPLSRENRPKQLLNITGSAQGGLIRKTVELIKPIIPVNRIKVVTALSQLDAIKKAIPEVAGENVIAEPIGKNTAPAIGISALFVERDDPNAVMAILPSDHYIEDEKKFRQTIIAGADHASEGDFVVTIGIPPRGPETGYGYIEAESIVDKKLEIYSVKSFHEKPDINTARLFIEKGNFFWNSGIFIVRASNILKEIKKYLPHNYRWLMKIKSSLGRDEESAVMREAYQNMETISIDYGVIEKSKHVLMVKGEFGWNDVGSWPSAAQYWPKDSNGNASIGELINLDSSQCIVYSPKKPVALLGAKDLIIVEEEDVILVCKKERSQDIGKFVEILRSRKRDELL